MTTLGAGLLAEPVQVMQIQGVPYFRHWQCPACDNFQVVTADPAGPRADVEARASEHFAACYDGGT